MGHNQVKEEWKCILQENGEQFVTIDGTLMMPKWSVTCWDTLELFMPHQLILEKEVDPFGCHIYVVEEQSLTLLLVLYTMDGDRVSTALVDIHKMQE